MKSIYDFPDVYDAVLRHSSEVIESEVNSICRLLTSRGIQSGKILELACGTAAHGIRLEKAGYEVTGIDRSQAMLDGAKVRAACGNGFRKDSQGTWLPRSG